MLWLQETQVLAAMKTADYVAIGVKQAHAKLLWLAFTAEPHILAELDGNSAGFVDPKVVATSSRAS